MANTDKLGIDVQRTVEAFADDVALVPFLQCAAVLDALWESAAPFRDAGEEDDVFAGEFAQSGEFLEWGWVALEDVFEGAHCEDAVARVECACRAVGFPAGHNRFYHCHVGVEGLFFGVGGFDFEFPACDRLEGFLSEGLVAHDFPAGEEDCEDFDEHDGEADPMK